VSDDEGRLESSLCLLNLEVPLLSPEILVREESVTNLVVLFDLLLLLGRSKDALRELLHGDRDPVEEVAGPGDGAGDGGQVTHHRWGSLTLLVDFFNLLHL